MVIFHSFLLVHQAGYVSCPSIDVAISQRATLDDTGGSLRNVLDAVKARNSSYKYGVILPFIILYDHLW